MTFNNPLSPLFALQNHVLDSVWSHTRLAHSLPYFTSSKVLGHSNLTMYSLLFPFRTPLPHRLHPCYVPPGPLPPLLSSILCGFPTHSDLHSSASWLVVTEFPLSPVVRLRPLVRWQKPDPSLPSLPVPVLVPNLVRLQFHIFFEFADIPFPR